MFLRESGVYDEMPMRHQNRIEDAADADAGDSAPAGAPTAPAAPETPVDTPGPASNPEGGQDGPPAGVPGPDPTPQAAPPAIASAVKGIEGSADTGGVKGSFEQAGTAGFARRFGGEAPAVWFRNAARGAAAGGGAPVAFQANRGATTRGGQQAGGAIPSVSAIPVGPEGGSQGGGPQDEEWQRFMQQVVRQRFGGG